MAHKTLIGGTAYEVKGGRCLVDGTGYSIQKGRTLIDGAGYDVSFGAAYDPVFANNDWATIIAACQANEVPDTWAVGDQKAMTINGVDYMIDIIGKNHDTYEAGGTAPLTFQMHDCYETAYQMKVSGVYYGWGGSSNNVRTVALPEILSLMPSEVQTAIKQVSKKAGYVSSGTKSIKTTSSKLFLLSSYEFLGKTGGAYAATSEGSQYEYYSVGNSAIKTVSGTAVLHWSRSLYSSDPATKAMLIGMAGSYTASFTSSFYYVAPAFCF